MLEFLQQLSGHLVTIFVVTSMLSVGLTQKPSRILSHLGNYRFLATMLVVNLIVVPALLIFALQFVPVAPHYQAGLLLYYLAAGAPFLIQLVKTSRRDLALAATTLMVLILGTVIVMPIVLPMLVEGVSITAWQIAEPMLVQILLPMVVGMLVLQFLEPVAALVQPWVARLASIALYVVIAAVLIGYSPAFADAELWVALAVGIVVLILAFYVGYIVGDGHDHLKDVGGLATAQRGTASALIVASNAFDDSRVLVVIIILNTFAFILLILAAKWLSPDNRFSFLTHVAADEPERQPTVKARTGAP